MNSIQYRNMTTILLVLFLLPVIGCTSKFGDKNPDGQNHSSGFTVEGRLKANEDLDNKLARLEDSTERVRKLIRAFRRVQTAKQGEDVYTHLDFLLDVNRELKAAPAQAENGKYIRLSKTTLTVKGLSPQCQTIETRLETLSKGATVDVSADNSGSVIDGVVFSVRTCHSQGHFLPIATVMFASTRTTLEFNNENLRKTIQELVTPVIQVNTNCEITVDAQNILAQAQCTNLVAKLSDSEKLIVENLAYNRTADVRVLLDAKIYGSDVAKATLYFSIDGNGKVDFKVENI